MRRTELKRQTPLARNSAPLRASEGLKRGNGLKRGKRAQRPSISAETMAVVVWRQGLFCACGCGRKTQPANPACWHHCIPKRLAPEYIDVPDNLVLVDVDCHSNHEVASRRFKRSVVWRAERLATTPQTASYLDRTYGPL